MNEKNFRPALRLFHPSAKGTGSALLLECVPACGENSGFYGFTLFPQKPFDGNVLNIKFDTDKAISFALDFTNASAMLQVFRGETESLNDGKGIFLKTDDCSVIVKFRHVIDPISGYVLEVTEDKTCKDGTKATSCGRFVFNSAEALGVCEAISQTIGMVAFGTNLEASLLGMIRAKGEEPSK